MAIKVRIIKKGYGHSPGQVLKLTEFDAGHLMAFGYAEPYVEKIETQMVAPPETRIEKPEEKISLFRRRGRRKKT